MTRTTIREGSQEPIDFWLQLDTDIDGHPDAPLVLTGYQSVELRVRAKETGVIRSFKTTDASPQLTVVNADGTASAPNGVLASQVRFAPSTTDFTVADGQYDCYLVVVDSAGKASTVPEHAHLAVFAFEKF